MTKLATVLATLLLSFILAACGGDNKNKGSNTNNNLLVQPTACPDLNDSSYRSDTLHSGDFIPSGFKQHWYLTFENNQAQFIESDFVIFADVTCEAGITTLAFSDRNVELTINEDASQLSVVIWGEDEVTFTRAATEPSDACQNLNTQIKNSTFVDTVFASLSTEQQAVSEPDLALIFDPIQKVHIRQDGESQLGIFDCSAGVLHLHYNQNDTSPESIELNEDGSISVIRPDGDIQLVSQSSYHPNCANESEGVATCVATEKIAPCDSADSCPGYISTPSTSCAAITGTNEFLWFGDDCNLYGGTEVVTFFQPCEQTISKVCAKTGTDRYITFNNACAAKHAFSSIAINDECGELNHTLSRNNSVPVRLLEDETPPDNINDQIIINSAELVGDELSVTLQQSMCREQQIDLYISVYFLETIPPRATWYWKPQNAGVCSNIIQTTYTYDLLPLKHYTQTHYPNIEVVSLGALGDYVITD